MQLSVKRNKREGSKITVTFTKCFRLFTRHLSSSLCHSSGTKELARQTMFFETKEKKIEHKERREMTQVRARVVAKAPGVSQMWF